MEQFWKEIAEKTFRILRQDRYRVNGFEPDDLTQQVLEKLLWFMKGKTDQGLSPEIARRILPHFIFYVWVDACRHKYQNAFIKNGFDLKHHESGDEEPTTQWHDPNAVDISVAISERLTMEKFIAFVELAEPWTDRDRFFLEERFWNVSSYEYIAKITGSTVDAIKALWNGRLKPILKDLHLFFTHAWFFPLVAKSLGPRYLGVDFPKTLRAKISSGQRLALAGVLMRAWQGYDDTFDIEIPDDVLGDFAAWIKASLIQPFLAYRDLSFRNKRLAKLERSWRWGYALWSSTSSAQDQDRQPPSDDPSAPIDKKDTSVKTRKPRTPEQKEADQALHQIMFETWFGTDDDELSPQDRALLDQVWETFQQQISTIPPQLAPTLDSNQIVQSWSTLLKQYSVDVLENLMRQAHWVLSPPLTASASDVSSGTQRFSVSLQQEFPIQGEIRKIELEIVQRERMLLLGHRLLDTESLPPHDTIRLNGILRFRHKSQIVSEHPVTLQLRMGTREYWIEQLPPTLLEEVPLEQMLVEWDFA